MVLGIYIKSVESADRGSRRQRALHLVAACVPALVQDIWKLLQPPRQNIGGIFEKKTAANIWFYEVPTNAFFSRETRLLVVRFFVKPQLVTGKPHEAFGMSDIGSCEESTLPRKKINAFGPMWPCCCSPSRLPPGTFPTLQKPRMIAE